MKKLKIISYKIFLLIFSIFTMHLVPSFSEQYYWENQERVTTVDSRFPSAVSNGNNAAFFWQEIDTTSSKIYLSGKFFTLDGWQEKNRFAGPFPYSGEIPDLYSVAMTQDGKICIAILSDINTISIFTTQDNGETFMQKKFERQKEALVAPRVYALNSGGFIIFTSLGKDESFSMLNARSIDGNTWNDFVQFSPTTNFSNPFLPVLQSTASGDFLIFQAQDNNGPRLSYQLYFTKSTNGGASWSTPVLVTGKSAVVGAGREYTDFHNQRANLYSKDEHLYVAWERMTSNSENAKIAFAELDESNGQIIGRTEEISRNGNASRPILFSYNDALSLVWFDTRRGYESVYLAQKNGYLWSEQLISALKSPCVFAYPIITHEESELSFIWQTNASNRAPSIYILQTDRTVKPPILHGINFTNGKRGKEERLLARVEFPPDSSGIKGFSWIWTQNQDEEVPHTLMNLPNETRITVNAQEDKNWYLKACVQDYAGNWSSPAMITYYRDLTPPNPPIIKTPPVDDSGFIGTSSFSMEWEDESPDEVIAGYSWNLEFQKPLPKNFASSSRHPTRISSNELKQNLEEFIKENPSQKFKRVTPQNKIMTTSPKVFLQNTQNGVYTFSVRSIDDVGNASEPSVVTLYINKFEPFTSFTSAKKSSDIFGNISLEIAGNGFLYDGTISSIEIQKQNKEGEPYKVSLSNSNGDYRVTSDSKIVGIKLPNTLPTGSYSITLNHSDRGSLLNKNVFQVENNGTIKIGKQYDYMPSWNYVYDNKFNVQIGNILFALIMILALTGLLFSVRGIVRVTQDARTIKLEVDALLKGDIMPLEKKQRVTTLSKKGLGLKIKLVSFTVFLVLMVSLLVSFPLGYIMTQTQERTLLKGLEQRVNVLLESLASGVRAYMPTQNVLELSYLPSQSSALSEANFVTITGFPQDDSSEDLAYVWATNDATITEKINTENFTAGVSKLTDNAAIQISEHCKNLNESAREIVGDMGTNIATLNSEGASLALRTDTASVRRRNEISEITRELTTKITENFTLISHENIGSYPHYNSDTLDRENTNYIFYRPVIYRAGNSTTYVRSIVFISISTKSLIAQIDADRKTIFLTALIISFLAILIGSIGALILATIIVNPIKRLASHVAMIGNTANKEKLAGKEIEIKSKDEIGQLGETVNEMMRGLVKAAQDEHILMDGKVVQQTFLPLGTDNKGNKQTTAMLNEPHLEFFGYYEGASGVSGDYFDYKKLDEKHYIVIKCDASGHGVPAALIMTVVATLFRKYYENWSYKKNGIDLGTLISQINDFIESLGIKGKFATLILALVDTQKGDVYLCNAGDNIVHIYDSASHKQKVLTLVETPAAGPLPSFMVEMKGGFKVEKTHLNAGDILFLYTDGIEESTRRFRDQNYEVIKCQEPGLSQDESHGNHKVGAEIEQLENDRICEIIECVLNKRVYHLEKYHNPVPNEILDFDFTTCKGTVEETILALASVEKVFRMYKEPTVTKADVVIVDKKIDAFLKEHFNLYQTYCASQLPSEEESNYVHYTNLKEDEQLDDLTLVALRVR